VSRSRTLSGAVLAAVCAVSLSACTAHPGQAALVGSEKISDHKVDDVAQALCSAQSGSQQTTAAQELSSRAARQGALDVLINSSLSKQFGHSQGVEPDQEQVSAAVSANAQTIAKLPKSRQSDFQSTLEQYAEGQLVLIDIGKASLKKAGTKNPTDEQSIAAGTKLRDAWAKDHASVKVNPRYGHYTNGALKSQSGSLSAPVSATAVTGAKPDPGQTWVASLPASQKCS
jgi:SurA N-terminal domain